MAVPPAGLEPATHRLRAPGIIAEINELMSAMPAKPETIEVLRLLQDMQAILWETLGRLDDAQKTIEQGKE